MTTTHFWKNALGKKIPLTLMPDDYLLNCYARCKEIVIASEAAATMSRLEEKAKRGEFVMPLTAMPAPMNPTMDEITQSPLSYEQAVLWTGRFEEEAKRRKLKLPVVTRHNLEERFERKRNLRTWKQDANKKWDEPFS